MDLLKSQNVIASSRVLGVAQATPIDLFQPPTDPKRVYPEQGMQYMWNTEHITDFTPQK